MPQPSSRPDLREFAGHARSHEGRQPQCPDFLRACSACGWSRAVDYVVAFSPAGIRWTHPDPHLIGKHVTGTFEQGLAGKPYTSTFDTPVGKAVDTTVPVIDADGSVVGLVAVGITVESVNERVARQLG
ncbi:MULTISPECIES: hypothetical protein [unclassified Streptomyces]|uniref:hypothetical protein n=1 Tax=unclassified Streptomyces TaxID=2593676 RepID=UPI00365A0B7D